MTVCVASLCVGPGGAIVVGAADQMLTTGDSEYEPLQAKHYLFKQNIAALIAGDITAQITICKRTAARVWANQDISVEEVASVYAEEFQTFRRASSEAVLLKPLGLDSESFLARQREMDPTIVQDITQKLINRDLDVSAIIMGRDASGHHIFAVHDPGEVYCADAIGFCAVGAGRRHAEAQFMMAGYSQHMPWEKALLLTYRAKKHAEVAPGVGARTDMYVVAQDFAPLDEVVYQHIHDSHTDLVRVAANATATAERALAEFLPTYLTAKQGMSPFPSAANPTKESGASSDAQEASS